MVETAVLTVKRRLNHTLYSKNRRAQKNELRLKVLTYNLPIIATLPTKSKLRDKAPGTSIQTLKLSVAVIEAVWLS